MRIIKTVVNELPEKCDECILGYHNAGMPACSAFGVLTMSPSTIEDEVFHSTRPDWCPLVLENDDDNK